MISNGRELYNLIDKLLKPEGFVRKKDTYYLHTGECICFFSIGKSPFGGHYDHVVGCFLKEIYMGKDEFPIFYKNHLKFGLDDLVEKESVKRVFDLENKEFAKNEREVIIEDLIESYAIPFLKEIGTKEGIKKAIDKYEDLKYAVVLDLKRHLGIHED